MSASGLSWTLHAFIGVVDALDKAESNEGQDVIPNADIGYVIIMVRSIVIKRLLES